MAEEKVEKKEDQAAGKMVAKKDWLVRGGDYDPKTKKHGLHLDIKKGDDLSKVKMPKSLVENLKTEGVI